jgi:hypothetical protein
MMMNQRHYERAIKRVASVVAKYDLHPDATVTSQAVRRKSRKSKRNRK